MQWPKRVRHSVMYAAVLSGLTVSACYARPIGAAQEDGPSASRYEITVWIVRPVIKRSPTAEQYEADWKRWTSLKSIEEGPAVKSDADLLRRLGEANPDFEFPRVVMKRSTTVPVDVPWAIGRPSPTWSLMLKVHKKERDAVIHRMMEGEKPEAIAKFRRAISGRVILEQRGQTATTEPGSTATKKFEIFHAVAPNAVIMVNGGLGFSSPGFTYVPEDLILISVKPLP
jgi:hypothetical protein